MLNIKHLQKIFPHPGKVVWIGLRPGRDAPLIEPEQALAVVGKGLQGDRFKGNSTSKRQVTLIQAEHLAVVAALLGRNAIHPSLLRRNIVVSGINLLALKDKTFSVGEAQLEMTGLCHPCSKMETVLGPGGYNALRGHGGITAKVVQTGLLAIGDKVFL
ncbi:MAG: MOSC domain-containing protein [Gammaproteobacteria bacterium]|nr:MOSC domain-containing protein [Gammaproteobacteria bacterium]